MRGVTGSKSPAEQVRRVVVLGKGTLAINISEWLLDRAEYELIQLVPVIPEPGWTGSLTSWAREREVPFVPSGNYADLTTSDHGLVADLGISVFYDRILPPDFISRFRRLLNIHNGPLPRYRGVSPINWALKNSEQTHGITIHEITTEVDAGPIVAQLNYSIYPEFDDVIDVYERALVYGRVLFEQTMPILDRIQPRPQSDADASYYSAADNASLGERAGFRTGQRPPP
jgi:methionyl-tRNA formyltransferase